MRSSIIDNPSFITVWTGGNFVVIMIYDDRIVLTKFGRGLAEIPTAHPSATAHFIASYIRSHLDEYDTLTTQEWRTIAETMPSPRLAMPKPVQATLF